jgi:hypothetical protein
MRGASIRYRPIIPIRVVSAVNRPPIDACIDTAADDTVFPPHLAKQFGIDLSKAPTGSGRVVGGAVVQVHYVQLTLLLADGFESCEWDSIVGFSTVPMRWALLGHAGFLEFFDVHFFGAKREVVLTPNVTFPGALRASISLP